MLESWEDVTAHAGHRPGDKGRTGRGVLCDALEKPRNKGIKNYDIISVYSQRLISV